MLARVGRSDPSTHDPRLRRVLGQRPGELRGRAQRLARADGHGSRGGRHAGQATPGSSPASNWTDIQPGTARPAAACRSTDSPFAQGSATQASAFPLGQVRVLTRRTGPRTGPLVSWWISGHIDSAEIGRDGLLSQPRTVRPSVGNAARSIAAWSATRRRFVRLGATMIQSETFGGASPRAIQPRSMATSTASRRFRSAVPTSSLTSAMSVFSSMTSSVRRRGCQARMSITPRSP